MKNLKGIFFWWTLSSRTYILGAGASGCMGGKNGGSSTVELIGFGAPDEEHDVVAEVVAHKTAANEIRDEFCDPGSGEEFAGSKNVVDDFDFGIQKFGDVFKQALDVFDRSNGG